jgi:Rieske Fe-S protein
MDSNCCTRRDVLQSIGCFGVTLAALGLSSSDARALPVFFFEADGAGSQRRYPIPAADSVTIDRSASLIVVRFNNQMYVFALSCPHQNNAVKWVAKEHRFQCTKHDSQYTPSGVYTTGHATRNMDRYLITRDGDSVVVDLHKWVQSDKDAASWTAATVAV